MTHPADGIIFSPPDFEENFLDQYKALDRRLKAIVTTLRHHEQHPHYRELLYIEYHLASLRLNLACTDTQDSKQTIIESIEESLNLLDDLKESTSAN